MSTPFNNRVFGCAIIKSINSNYNADFSHQPRTLPDGTVYATDKVLKYSVRNLIAKHFSEDKMLYFKTMNAEMQPRSLGESYAALFGEIPKSAAKKVEDRKGVLKNLLSCIDVRLFGGTFAEKGVSLSLHGTTQITHGVNRFPENAVYSEQISSPFRNANEKSMDSMQTTLGTQFKLKEGHYVHHFSINPKNIEEFANISNGESLNTDDISKLKTGLTKGCTFYDSSAKAGTENELMLWIQLKDDSKLVLPSFVELVKVNTDDKRTIDLTAISNILKREKVKAAIEKIEIYYDKAVTTVTGILNGAIHHEIHH